MKFIIFCFIVSIPLNMTQNFGIPSEKVKKYEGKYIKSMDFSTKKEENNVL